jgi:hypothetical protein
MTVVDEYPGWPTADPVRVDSQGRPRFLPIEDPEPYTAEDLEPQEPGEPDEGEPGEPEQPPEEQPPAETPEQKPAKK